eukprot:751733-Hanusia_phi.AAC.3
MNALNLYLHAMLSRVLKSFQATSIANEMKSALDIKVAEQASALEALRSKLLDSTLNAKEEIDTGND